jgi:hypothetical protein
MTKKVFLLRFAGFLLIAMAALPAFALTFNALVLFDLIPAELKDKTFGNELTFRAVIVWCGALILGFAGIFPQENWRHVLYFSPLYAPALYAVVHTLTQ